MSLMTAGQTLDGTYRLLRLIGEGGMGEVYEATHARLAGRYAIKVLLHDLTQNPEAVARFDREARVTSLLQHPNVVQVIDHNTSGDGTEYLVMEYLDGESLAQRMARTGRLPLGDVVAIVDQLAAGLAAAHAHGIVHRDLKPDNVFLVHVEGRDAELVKILDFGISKIRGGAHTQNRQICGTPQYMAPEQVEARATEIGGATDQFALAVIAYELLTGRNPFMGESLAAIFEKVLRAVPPPTGMNRAIDAVLTRGMSKSHLNRYPSATEFADALRLALLPPRKLASMHTPGYVAGEISQADLRQLKPRRWGLPLVLLAIGGMAAIFLIQGSMRRTVSPAPAPSVPAPVAAATVLPLSVHRDEAPPAPAPAAPAPLAEAAPAPSAVTEVRGRELPQPRVVAPELPRPHASAGTSSHAAKSRPHRPERRQAMGPPADDDVLPLSETLDNR